MYRIGYFFTFEAFYDLFFQELIEIKEKKWFEERL